jgi:hypothetical protein
MNIPQMLHLASKDCDSSLKFQIQSYQWDGHGCLKLSSTAHSFNLYFNRGATGSVAEGKGRKSGRGQLKKNDVLCEDGDMANCRSLAENSMLGANCRAASGFEMPAASQPSNKVTRMTELFSPAILWENKYPMPVIQLCKNVLWRYSHRESSLFG